jgi:hypothetical protein
MPSGAPARRSVLQWLVGVGTAIGSGVGTGVMGAGALSTLTGCTTAPPADPSSPRDEPGHDRGVDLAVVSRARAASQHLAQRYADAVAALPDLAGALTPLAAEHAAHIRALDTTAASATATTQSPAPVSPRPVRPVSAGEAIAALAAAERASATARVADVLTCSPDVARLLASIAACQATHAAVLGTPPLGTPT